MLAILVVTYKVDQIIATVDDINGLLSPSMREDDNVKKKVMREQLTTNDLPRYFGYLEDLLKEKNSHWFVGDKMSVADIAVWSMLGWIASGALDDINSELLNPFDRLKKLFDFKQLV